MDDVSHQRHPVGLHTARRAASLAMAACLLASCTTQEPPDREAAPERTASRPPTSSGDAAGHGAAPTLQPEPEPAPAPDETPRDLPRLPTTRSAPALAGHLDRAVTTVRDRDAAPIEVRLAAEFHQLAVHALANASRALRRKVLARLPPRAAREVRGDVTATRLIQILNTPQPTLPRWRIVRPRPRKELIGYYRRSQRRTGVPWNYLAAIHLVETRMGRIRGTSTAGAVGPMQFIPTTWELYGGGGDIDDPRDAILAAGRLLADHGAPGDMAEALWHYNPSDHYVRAVTLHARSIQRSRSAYRGYRHWRVLYDHTRGTYLLPVGYPDERAVLLPDR